MSGLISARDLWEFTSTRTKAFVLAGIVLFLVGILEPILIMIFCHPKQHLTQSVESTAKKERPCHEQ